MKALNDVLILLPKQKENKTESGLILAPKKKEFLETATVVSKGTSVEEIDEGDEVVFKNVSPIEYNKDNKTYLIITKYDVFLNLSK